MGQGQSARRVINDAAFVTDTTAAHLAETGQDSSRWVAEVHPTASRSCAPRAAAPVLFDPGQLAAARLRRQPS